MPVRISERFIVFRVVKTPQGPAPKPICIVKDEQLARFYIAEAQANGAVLGWSYARCAYREEVAFKVEAGSLPGYRIPTINNPNISR
jgi:hypothetical protein